MDYKEQISYNLDFRYGIDDGRHRYSVGIYEFKLLETSDDDQKRSGTVEKKNHKIPRKGNEHFRLLASKIWFRFPKVSD